MSLRDRLQQNGARGDMPASYAQFGVISNPYPSSNQTSNNPHFPTEADAEAERKIVSFMGDNRSQVVVVQGTQGVGKTNFLNHFEREIRDAVSTSQDYYVVRYLADPEASFEATIRRLFQEFGLAHLERLGGQLETKPEAVGVVRSYDMRAALQSLIAPDSRKKNSRLMLEWLLGVRLLKAHRENLEIQFRLDTVESKTAALRDLVEVSSTTGILKGIFLLLDELEKQEGVLGPTAITRYLSAMRAIIDALPRHLFMMIAITPDAMRRYAAAAPAFRSRLQNQINLPTLSSFEQAEQLADFYMEASRAEARGAQRDTHVTQGDADLITPAELRRIFSALESAVQRRAEPGVRQREFLHELHTIAEHKLQKVG